MQELQNLIELDVASYDIFDLPPLNEYELYIKNYGQSDCKQVREILLLRMKYN